MFKRFFFQFPLVSWGVIQSSRLLFAAGWALALLHMYSLSGICIAIGILGSTSYFRWDPRPLDAHSGALYALHGLGECLTTGAVCLAFLMAYRGWDEGIPMVGLCLAGGLALGYSIGQVQRRAEAFVSQLKKSVSSQ